MASRKQLETRQLLDNLESEWKPFPSLFQELTAQEKADYLQKQGYSSFHDLLAHITAWWQEAINIVNSILDLDEMPRKEYDIDAFNADALLHFKNWKDEDLLIHYENLHQSLVTLVFELPQAGLHNPRINSWLDACLVEHYEEHKITE